MYVQKHQHDCGFATLANWIEITYNKRINYKKLIDRYYESHPLSIFNFEYLVKEIIEGSVATLETNEFMPKDIVVIDHHYYLVIKVSDYLELLDVKTGQKVKVTLRQLPIIRIQSKAVKDSDLFAKSKCKKFKLYWVIYISESCLKTLFLFLVFKLFFIFLPSKNLELLVVYVISVIGFLFGLYVINKVIKIITIANNVTTSMADKLNAIGFLLSYLLIIIYLSFEASLVGILLLSVLIIFFSLHKALQKFKTNNVKAKSYFFFNQKVTQFIYILIICSLIFQLYRSDAIDLTESMTWFVVLIACIMNFNQLDILCNKVSAQKVNISFIKNPIFKKEIDYFINTNQLQIIEDVLKIPSFDITAENKKQLMDKNSDLKHFVNKYKKENWIWSILFSNKTCICIKIDNFNEMWNLFVKLFKKFIPQGRIYLIDENCNLLLKK